MESFIWLTPPLLITLLLIFALLRRALEQRYPISDTALIDTVDALLPQTQCAQCGYPGCRPYAEAIVNDSAALNLCPPGGAEVYQQLTELMGGDHTTPPVPSAPAVAIIDEAECIGCTLCLPPCPVDAIIGAQGQMHTVLARECTGCELCLPACPVDCISMVPVSTTTHSTRSRSVDTNQTTVYGCIQCGQCNNACPLNLPAQNMLHWVEHDQHAPQRDDTLLRCVECGLCDRACPSNIPLANLFGQAIQSVQQMRTDARQKDYLKDRFAAHNARLAAKAESAASKRQQRLDRSKQGAAPWQQSS